MPDFHPLNYVFFGFLLIQLAIYLFQYSRLLLIKQTFKSDSIRPVSIIVSARNEFENLKKLIPALLSQQHPQFEIIIVDDRSVDESYDFLMEQAAQHANLHFVRIEQTPEHISNKKYALTLGIKKAQYDTLLFTDADCLPADDQWAAKMSASHQQPKGFVLGFSGYEKRPGVLNFFVRYETIVTGIQYLSAALAGYPYMGVGRNLSYSRSYFLDNKGFQKHLKVIAGDDDLYVNEHANRKNTAICIQKGAYTLSVPKTSWREYYKQKLRHLTVGKKYRMTDKIRLGIEQGSHIFCLISFALAMGWGNEHYWLLGGLLLRWLWLGTIVFVLGKKIGLKFETWLVPVLDILYALYYLMISPFAALNKKIEWK
jgi:glycosyltransferase involved in cell wall biosynthesis